MATPTRRGRLLLFAATATTMGAGTLNTPCDAWQRCDGRGARTTLEGFDPCPVLLLPLAAAAASCCWPCSPALLPGLAPVGDFSRPPQIDPLNSQANLPSASCMHNAHTCFNRNDWIWGYGGLKQKPCRVADCCSADAFQNGGFQRTNDCS